jgi:NAD(P)-dependent dehydrogenase (short-subunit alcohol dehydrogenase family)
VRLSHGDGADLRGKVALLTGATGPIAAAVARTFSRFGADVFLVDDDIEALEELAGEIRAAGRRAQVCAIDITEAANCHVAVADAIAAFGRLDALCNIANAFVPASAADMAPEDFGRTLAVNMAAPFYMFQAAIPHLIEAHGAVVNVTSCAAFLAQPNTVAYSASKAGMNHMTRVLAKEYADASVRINAIAPGAIAVDLVSKSEPKRIDPSTVQLRAQGGRGMIPVDDLAEAIVFLASDAAAGFHGASISMDNGIGIG